MMPTAVAITSAVWPSERRGYALGILAGASAFFAAVGPVLGGLLTSVSWRLVFLVNVPLALITILITVTAVLSAIELGVYFPNLYGRLAARGITPTPAQAAEAHQFIARAEEQGLHHVDQPGSVQATLNDLITAHILAFQITFIVAAAIALLGAATSFVLVRDRTTTTSPAFGRRSRWIPVTQGSSPAITRLPPGTPGRA
jgi:hypothetical protein